VSTAVNAGLRVAKGGSSEEHNGRLACFDCNRSKSDTYESFDMITSATSGWSSRSRPFVIELCIADHNTP
jgi:hypothetical protein